MQQRVAACVDIEDINQVTVLSQDGEFLSGLPDTYAILTVSGC